MRRIDSEKDRGVKGMERGERERGRVRERERERGREREIGQLK